MRSPKKIVGLFLFGLSVANASAHFDKVNKNFFDDLAPVGMLIGAYIFVEED